MIIYKDLLSGDELLSDSYNPKEAENGFFYEVEGKWEVLGDVEVDTGANPSAEGGDEDGGATEGRKVVDLIEYFKLNEQPPYSKKDFTAYVKPWLGKLIAQLPEDQANELKSKAEGAIKFLLGKIKSLQFFLGESLDPEATMVYAYYREGATNPTFLYPKYALKEEKM